MGLPLTARIIAGAGGFVAALSAIGAKMTIALLGIWSAVVALGAFALGAELRKALSVLSQPTVVAALAFAGFASLSATWSLQPLEALKAGSLLAYAIFAGVVLSAGLAALDFRNARLVAGWFSIGLVAGTLVLLAELITRFAMYRTFLNIAESLRPTANSMIYYRDGQAIIVLPSIANWSIAFLNMVLWPSLLLVSSLWRERRWRFAPHFLFALFLFVTFVSDHQTSWVAIVAGAATYLLARWRTDLMRYAVLAVFALAVLTVVPVSQALYHNLEMQNRDSLMANLRIRFVIWGYTADRVHEAPIAGVGAVSTPVIQKALDAQSPEADRDVLSSQLNAHTHNMLLQTWFELGAIGAALILLIAVFAWRAVGGFSRMAQPFGLATMVVMFIESIATWSIWHAWFTSALVLSAVLLGFANRVANDVVSTPAPTFWDIWLPDSMKRRKGATSNYA